MSNNKNLFEEFPEYSEEKILKIVNELTPAIKEILMEVYGPDLKQKRDSKKLSKRKNDILETTIKKTIIMQLNKPKRKRKYEFILSGSIIDDTIKRIEYKPLTKNQETIWIKKAKLAFYYEVDEETQRKYFEYYCEAKPRFKEKYEKANEEEKQKLLKKAIEDSTIEKNKFLENNQRLILTVIYKTNDLSLSKEELMQEANIGLIKALEKFDIEADNKFSTYATWWIKQSINRYIENNGKTIRVPSYLQIEQHKILTKTNELRDKLKRTPTIEEIAEETELSEKRIKLIRENLAYQTNIKSLNEPLLTNNNEKGETLENLIPDNNSNFTDEIEQKLLVNYLQKIIKKLNKTSQVIINMRMGFYDGTPHTLEEVAQHLNISREKVRKIEIETLKQIKSEYEKKQDNFSSKTIVENNEEKNKTTKEQIYNIIASEIDALNKIEQYVLIMKYKLLYDDKTAALILNKSEDEIRKIEKKALRNVRRLLDKKAKNNKRKTLL